MDHGLGGQAAAGRIAVAIRQPGAGGVGVLERVRSGEPGSGGGRYGDRLAQGFAEYVESERLGHVGDVMFFQPDGNLVIYTADGAVLWTSNTAN